MVDLKETWRQLVLRYTSNTALVEENWKEIENAYSKGNRHYHNLEHLRYMMTKAVECKDQIKDIDTILFSIFYHDIVYKTSRQDNEERSADIACQRLAELGASKKQIASCREQILATKSHSETADNDINYLVDIDLAILGEAPNVYGNYIKNVRAEYAIYPNFLYKRGRKKVLAHFLEMERIFKTRYFYNNFEEQARKNLRKELEALR